MTPTDLAYCAGVIDSDGCINIKRDIQAMKRGGTTMASYQPRVMVKQVTPQAVDLLHALFGGHLGIAGPSLKGGRPLFSWTVTCAKAVTCLEHLHPYLRIKPRQAEVAIELGRVNRLGRRFVVPDIIPGEPLVTLAEAAPLVGRSLKVLQQSACQGSVPTVKVGRHHMVPVSYLPVWRDRTPGPRRLVETTEQLHALWERMHELNRVGI